VNFWNS